MEEDDKEIHCLKKGRNRLEWETQDTRYPLFPIIVEEYKRINQSQDGVWLPLYHHVIVLCVLGLLIPATSTC